VAHYDSVPTAPGAADDASGVAALLETARALRFGPLPRNDDYTRGFLGERPRAQQAAAYFPQMGSRPALEAPAPPFAVRPPALRLLADDIDGDRRTVRLRLRSVRGAAVISLLVHTVVGNLTASVDGHELGARDTTLLDETTVRWSFDFHAPPSAGIDVTLDFAAGPPVRLRAVDLTYGLPAGAAGRYPARPAGMLPGRIGDATLAETVLWLPRTTVAAKR